MEQKRSHGGVYIVTKLNLDSMKLTQSRIIGYGKEFKTTSRQLVEQD